MHRTSPSRSIALLAGLVAAAVAAGCATGGGARPAGRPAPAGGTAAPPAADRERLVRLAAERRSEGSTDDYVVGPGDLLAIGAYDVAELSQKVRVDGQGAITLPLLETVPVAGRTVPEIQQDLTRRLGAFVYDAHVDVAVEEYRSQQVAVLGAVQRPGVVPQTTRNATVRDAVAAAGGFTSGAGTRVYFVPAAVRNGDGAGPAHAALPGAPAAPVDAQAIAVDTRDLGPDARQLFFDMPLRSGDVITVAQSGHVVVEGWVGRPGRYPLESGLTLRGAVATAGGFKFPARTGRIRIYRTSPQDATSVVEEVDYAAIAADRAPDVHLQDGDVVEVAASPVKLLPYGLFRVATQIVNVAAGVKVVP